MGISLRRVAAAKQPSLQKNLNIQPNKSLLPRSQRPLPPQQNVLTLHIRNRRPIFPPEREQKIDQPQLIIGSLEGLQLEAQ